MSFKIAQNVTKYSATFVRQFVSKNFQKSPNLVTLLMRTRANPLRAAGVSFYFAITLAIGD